MAVGCFWIIISWKMLFYVPKTAYVLDFFMPLYFFKDLIDMLSNFFVCNWSKYWRIKSALYIELILICSILLYITSSSCHKNQILKSWWEWQPSLPHSCPLEHRHFTSLTGHPDQTFWQRVYFKVRTSHRVLKILLYNYCLLAL